MLLDECDALTGNFQCAIVAKVKGKSKHPKHRNGAVIFEIVRGMYKLRSTTVSKPSDKCKYPPPTPPNEMMYFYNKTFTIESEIYVTSIYKMKLILVF